MSVKISKKGISVRMKTYNAPKHKACSNKQCAMIGVICSKYFEKPEQSRN